jgi:DNA (cytosine-5)-methyltransferase 1
MSQRKTDSIINAVDLFCGVGGLTKGLSNAGISVVAGIDVDTDCEYPYEANNNSIFHLRDIAKLDFSFVQSLFPPNGLRVLAGCAPCQPFSRYARSAATRPDRWTLLQDFGRIAVGVKPDVITMENVPELLHHEVFECFVSSLLAAGYSVSHQVLHCAEFGVPQQRKRLVLLASIHGDVQLPWPTLEPRDFITVRSTIAHLPAIEAGKADANDAIHRSCRLSEINLKRIAASTPGGTWRDWPKHLVAKCHILESGATYPSVYGRMIWDAPAPTITTQFFGYGNGRFGHPDQNRAISLREGAMLQSFPKKYKFHPPQTYVSAQRLGKLIGNAVPVKLGEAIGKAIKRHFFERNLIYE